MQLTIAVFDDRVVTVEVEDGATLETLKAILEAELGVPQHVQLVLHNGAPLASKSLSAQGVQAGDLLMLEKAQGSPAPSQGRGAGSAPIADAEQLLQQLRSMPQDQMPPPLRDAVNRGDLQALARFAEQIAQRRDPLEEEEMRLLAAAEADPFNVDIQRRLEEIIREKNVRENLDLAMEYNPEAFGSVHMLYISGAVNGHQLKAFVDSGAQMTIMSEQFAEECGLTKILDRRFGGIAKGVGTQRIIGRIHMAPMEIAGKHIPISITVLEGKGMKFLFGLDNLKRHQCSIDLQANVLRFPALDVAVPFLAEHELPKDDLFSAEEIEEMEKKKLASEPSQGGASGSGAAGTGAPASAPAPAAAAAPAPAAAAGGAGGLPAGWEEKVKRLIDLGFPRDQCVAALKMTNGNEDMAASVLFGGF